MLDTSIAEVLRSGDQKHAAEYEESGPKLSIFEERDHGALLQTFGRRRSALQYEIGNPLTASKMTRYHRSRVSRPNGGNLYGFRDAQGEQEEPFCSWILQSRSLLPKLWSTSMAIDRRPLILRADRRGRWRHSK